MKLHYSQITLISYIILVLDLLPRDINAQVNGSFESKFKRYLKEEIYTGDISHTETLTAWKGERVYTQMVLWSTTDQDNLTYDVSNFTNGTISITSDQIQLLFATDVKGDKEARSCGTYSLPRLDSVWVADALSFTPKTILKSNNPIKLWLRLDVPVSTAAGSYTGTITVNKSGSAQIVFTLQVEVLDKVLPDVSQWQFHLDLWQYPYQILKHYNDDHPSNTITIWSDQHFNMFMPYYELLADAGQKVITAHIKDDAQGQPSMVAWTLKSDGTWEYDFTAFDKFVNALTAIGISKQINCFSPVGWNGDVIPYYDEASNSSKTLSAPIGSAVFQTRWDHFLSAFRTHLVNKGWFDKTVLYLDEIEEHLLSDVINVVKGNHQDWKLGLTYFNPLSQSNADAMYDLSGILGQASSVGRNGKVSTFYTSCNQTIPNDYVTPENSPGEMNWMAWHVANQELDGYLRWGYDYWTLNDPTDVRNGAHTAGDFSMVYRSSNALNAEVYSSYRLEHLRNGIQDFEKIRILKSELETSADPFDQEALALLNTHIDRFGEASGLGADALVQQGETLLNDIVKGTFSYCKITGATSSDQYTQWVATTGATNNLGHWSGSYPGGYSRIQDQQVSALPGSSFTFTVENSSTSGCARTKVWVDWNGDQDFDDAGEVVFSAGTTNSCSNALSNTFNVSVPQSAKKGLSRIRIQLRPSSGPEPIACGNLVNASTKDFNIEILDTYCNPGTEYNDSYFIRALDLNSCHGNIDFNTTYVETEGYAHYESEIAVVERRNSFNLFLENSPTAGCARSKVWVDWNQDGDFADVGEEVYTAGSANSCANARQHHLVVTVPTNAAIGQTRMRVQLRDAYQPTPMACVQDAVAGTTDFTIEVIDNAPLACDPVLLSPLDQTKLQSTSATIIWASNGASVELWKLEVTSQDLVHGEVEHISQTYGVQTSSVLIDNLPNDGRPVELKLSWLEGGVWKEITSKHRAYDTYCDVGGGAYENYYVQRLTTIGGETNLDQLATGYPTEGYDYHRSTRLVMNEGGTATIHITPSAASNCARMKVWIDWNEDSDFNDPGEEVYSPGIFQSCGNPFEYTFNVTAPSGVLGLKRMRVQLRDSFNDEPVACGINDFSGTTDFDLEVVRDVQRAELGYDEDFETSGMPAFWTTATSNSNGLVSVTKPHGFWYSHHVLKLGRVPGSAGIDPVVSADLNANLLGGSDVKLKLRMTAYAWYDQGNVPDPVGVFLSDDGGTTFVKVFNAFNFTTYPSSHEYILNISDLTTQYDLGLTADFVVRFQYQVARHYPQGLEIFNAHLYEDGVSSARLASGNDSHETTAQVSVSNNSVNLYPNPSNGHFVITLGELFDETKVRIRIYDQSGKIIYKKFMRQQPGQRQIHIDLLSGSHRVKTGLYHIDVSNGSTKISRKLWIRQ